MSAKCQPVKGTSAVPVLHENKPTGDVRMLVPLDRGLSASGSFSQLGTSSSHWIIPFPPTTDRSSTNTAADPDLPDQSAPVL